MRAYQEAYLDEVVETQGKLFDEVSSYSPGIDVDYFIEEYMRSKTRSYIDHAQAYVCTMDAPQLWEFFRKTDDFVYKAGQPMLGFKPDWIGRFYAYFQWYYNMESREVLHALPLKFMKGAYYGLHDLDLDLAVKKVGERIV